MSIGGVDMTDRDLRLLSPKKPSLADLAGLKRRKLCAGASEVEGDLGFTTDMSQEQVQAHTRALLPDVFRYFDLRGDTSESGQAWYLCSSGSDKNLQVVLHDHYPNGNEILLYKKRIGHQDINYPIIFLGESSIGKCHWAMAYDIK